MNKQELIDKAVITLGGKWIFPDDNLVTPSTSNSQYKPHAEFESICNLDHLGPRWEFVCNKEDFQQRASELGYINGYRWGVEYPTNGKKPDLPDDLVIEWRAAPHPLAPTFEKWIECEVGKLCWSVDVGGAVSVAEFKITDQRYKPADTSYLDSASEAAESKSSAESVSESAELSIAIADAMNVAVESGEIEIAKRLQEINKDVLAEANKRKAEAEKKRVVDAVQQLVHEFNHCVYVSDELLAFLHDKGYLRTPSK